MVVKTEDGTNFSTLTPRRTYEDDAVSARFAVFQQNLNKKQQPPSGGIWDVDMEKSVVTGSMELRQKLNSMLQQESPYMDIEDRMDTGETSRSVSSDSMSSLAEAQESDRTVPKMAVVKENNGKGKKKTDSTERSKRCLSDTSRSNSSDSVSSLTEVDLKTVSKMAVLKNNEKGKKKTESTERSKRIRTSSKTEEYPLDPLLGELQMNPENNTQQKKLAEHKPCEGATAEAIFLDVQKNLMPQMTVINPVPTSKESQVKAEKGGSAANTEKANLYQKEIDDLQRVSSIFEKLGVNDVEGSESYSEDVKILQGISMKLQQLGEATCPISNENSDHPESDHKSATSCNVAGEAAFTVLNEIHRNESQFTELLKLNQTKNSDTPTDKSSETEAIATECVDPLLQKIMNGTLPWQQIGSPPPAMAFSSSNKPIDNPNTTYPPTVQSLMSSAKDSLSTEQMLHFKLLALQAENIDTKPSVDETSRVKSMETDSDFEFLKNETLPSGFRGSPPPIAAFSSTLSPVSPTGSKGASNSKAQDESSYSATLIRPKHDQASAIHEKSSKNEGITFLQTSEITNETPKVDLVALLDEKSLDFLKQHGETKGASGVMSTVNSQLLTSRTSKSCLNLNSGTSGSFKAKSAQHQRSSRKASDTSAPYMAKEPKPKPVVVKYPEALKPVVIKYPERPKPVVIKYPEPKPPVVIKDPVATSSRYIPPHQRPKSTWKSDIDVSRNPQDQGFRTGSWQNWRKEDSPMNNLGSNRSISYNDQASKPNNNYKEQPPIEEKVLNVVKSTVPGSDSEPSVTPFKPNGAADNYRTNLNSNSERFLNKTGSESGPFSSTYKPNSSSTANIYRTRHHSNSEKFSKYKSSENLNAMISVKIFDDQNAVVDELMLDGNLLEQRMKLFPNLLEVVPRYNEKDKVLPMSGSAVQTYLRSVFHLTYKIPGWTIALESYYLAKKYGSAKLQEDCKRYFNDKPIQPNQVQEIVQTARKLQITDALVKSKMFAEVQSHQIQGAGLAVTVKEPKCTVSCTVYSEPSEFYVPLTCNEEKGLGSRRESDIKNEIIFEALSGTFSLIKLQIKLEVEGKDLDKYVTIFCDVYKNNRKVFDLERRKRLNKLMIVDFNRRLIVEPKETVTISILIEDACIGMLPCLIREKEVGRCPGNGSFEVSFVSDTKSEAKQPLFFVEKLFYTFEGKKN